MPKEQETQGFTPRGDTDWGDVTEKVATETADAEDGIWPDYVEPTAEQVAELNHGAFRMLGFSVLAQFGAGAVVAAIAGLVSGVAAGVSALAGAAACAVPSALFALRLAIGMAKPGGANPATFFLGEFLKLGSTALLLWLVVRVGQDHLVWPAMFAGLIVALKSHYWLLLFKDS